MHFIGLKHSTDKAVSPPQLNTRSKRIFPRSLTLGKEENREVMVPQVTWHFTTLSIRTQQKCFQEAFFRIVTPTASHLNIARVTGGGE